MDIPSPPHPGPSIEGPTSFARIFKFHSTFFPSYGPTPLHSLPSLASEHGVRGVYLKDERSRCGLPAFKILGASWALCSVLADRWGCEPGRLDALQACAKGEAGLTVYAATDGNHGRAVARTARQIGLACRIYVPRTVEAWSVRAIQSEGAEVQVVDGDYDQAIEAARRAAAEGEERGVLIQDTSWEGYEDVPMRIVHGYTKLFFELSAQLPPEHQRPTHIIVPVGVGSLAHSAVLYTLTLPPESRPRIMTVEPDTAACLATALRTGDAAGGITTGATIMPGLNCGTVSPLAWPDLRRCVRPEDAVCISDEECRGAMRALEKAGYPVGPCGAAPLAALRKVQVEGEGGLGDGAVVVLICTEGPEER